MDQIIGYVESIVFSNAENGFTVARLQENGKDHLTCIVGTFPSLQPGESLTCQGEWKFHSVHGRQFEVQQYQVTFPADLLGIQKYLESGLVKGIGPIYAKKIIDSFGLQTLDVIDQQPQRLKEIQGIGKKRIQKILECWSQQKSIREVMVFLQSFGVSPSFAQKIYKSYGNEAIKKVRENPYQLARDIFGIGFKSADRIAQKMGWPLHSSLRIAAGIEFVLWELTNMGHCCYPKEEFLPLAEKILEVERNLVETELESLIEAKKLISSPLPVNGEGVPFLWLKPLYFFEEGIAKELLRLHSHPSLIRSIDVHKALEWVQIKLHISLAPEQIKAVEKGISEKIHIITGGPGTGKSTITNAILSITEKVTHQILLAAPTGRAAKRMTQITHKKAFTIHSLLEFDFITGGFKRNQENPLSCSLIIIDEMSMIDTPLMYHLLKALPSEARVLFIGDIDQLPSVGPGYILKDLIRSDRLGVTGLTEIFRQAAGSKIIVNAHRVNRGEFPLIQSSEKSDFLFFECTEVEEIEKKIVDLVCKELPEKKHFHPLEDIQVLSPMKRGRLGSENLNLALQQSLNPSATPFFRNGQRFHIHDKVMQIKNNYNKKVYNGDIGKIVQIDLFDHTLSIHFDGHIVSYDFAELDEIVLAYAVSVHKYQGSECPCVVIPIHSSHFKLLHRNLLYTALTRGKKLVILVGTKKAIAIAVHNNDVLKRYTGLEQALRRTLTEEKVAHE